MLTGLVLVVFQVVPQVTVFAVFLLLVLAVGCHDGAGLPPPAQEQNQIEQEQDQEQSNKSENKELRMGEMKVTIC